MLDETTGWALIDGAAKPKERRMWIEAIQKFWAGGVLIETGTKLEVSSALASEVISSQKARIIDEPIASQEVSHGSATENDAN